tara:strand:- start:42 stop:494 length:453 start_codon:yes stop_codon:yes gene_type:complete
MTNDFGKFFENFKINQKIKHYPGKSITESDNNLFCLLTMNHHPVHLDQNYAKKSKHKKVLVNGLLIISTVVGMTVRDISGKAIANLEYDKVIHHNPTFLNDTLYAETTVISKKLSKNKKHGVVHVKTKSFNQNKKLVLSFERKILVPRKD